ncbi:CRISPR-associated protein Cas5 domain-containing protein [Desulfonema limicola]|uniref:CRISPR-associated protein Cas5 domain-containing protein n=1 Tax=Desulfonema limicola TaxID=45656 RepID=A0A975GH00_9BACT|nr:CRISPR-associated protein Cas5 [Desulfonema limicola]QTA80759.1 CRISPR-associated protein Cas5 domain-containing protein [Desulfonema limicola]
MEFISFQLKGRTGHFLKAEGGASALSYPFPPRTVILGLLGAVLGLAKDEPQIRLEPASIAVSGKLPTTFWHKVKLRKEDPEYLSISIKKTQKASASGKDSRATLILQEWLFEPEYTLWVSIPEPYHSEISKRLEHRQWHFQPCMGLSEMMADLLYKGKAEAELLKGNTYNINTVFPRNCGEPDFETMFEQELSINSMRMPRSVTTDRVFAHAEYYMERDARPVPVKTDKAYQWKNQVIVCL